MNLIEDNIEVKKKGNSKKIAKIILIVILLLVIFIIGLFGTIMYMKDKELKLYIDGRESSAVKDMMVIDDDGTVYFPIKEIANYFGYESYNGEYADKSENASKCYIQGEDEIANFSLNSKTIYKLAIGAASESSNYEYYYASKPVKAMQGKLYISSDGIEKAFNVSFSYNTVKQRAYFYTMPYLIDRYSPVVLDYGYTAIIEDFTNHKTVLNDMLVVSKGEKTNYGIISTDGTVILETKYDDIEYIPTLGDFLITSNGKVGLFSAKKGIKIQILYDDLELIDSDLELFVAEKEKKYGIMDSNGNTKVYIEYDEIGIDNSKYEKNNVKNRYLLADKLIPIRKDKLWGLFDKNGNKIVDFEYDNFGYIAPSNKDAINLIVIPDYDIIIACKNKKYTLINTNGDNLCATVLDDVYMTISSGKKYYYMTYNDQVINVEEFLDRIGVKTKNNTSSNSQSNSSNEDENTTTENATVEDEENIDEEAEVQEEEGFEEVVEE